MLAFACEATAGPAPGSDAGTSESPRGDGTVSPPGDPPDGSTSAAQADGAVAGPARASLLTKVAVGLRHACAIRPDGTVACWGDDSKNQLGASGTGVVAVTGVTGAISLAAGASATCALLGGGSVTCWGGNGKLPPTPVSGVSDVAAIASGAYFGTSGAEDNAMCALSSDHRVRCWEAGLDTTKFPPVALSAAGTTSVASLAPPCFVQLDGSVYCGTHSLYTDEFATVTESGIADAVSVHTGEQEHGDPRCILGKTTGLRCSHAYDDRGISYAQSPTERRSPSSSPRATETSAPSSRTGRSGAGKTASRGKSGSRRSPERNRRGATTNT